MHNVPNHHIALMKGLETRHDFLLGLIGSNPFHYVDPPMHGNIGDLLIMHGTLEFFRKAQRKPKLVAPYYAYSMDWIDDEDVIVFHGGGNFGDIYFGMHQLREKVIEANPKNRIIIFPQSIHFSSIEARKKSANRFRKHPDVHLCVRDQVSFEIAQDFTDHVYLVPDMAHHLYPIQSSTRIVSNTAVLIQRTDDEATPGPITQELNISIQTDWPQLVGWREIWIRLLYRVGRVFMRTGMGRQGNRLLFLFWKWYSQRLIKQAIALFSGYERIVTDRLHGHILACLMNKPSVVLDNSYGKNSRYVNVWTGASELVSLRQTSAAGVFHGNH